MTFTIQLGWWLVPALITAAAFGWSTWQQDRSPAYDYGKIGQGIGNAVMHGIALIVTLAAWMIWALIP
ncbi:hypothetical protein D3227_04800 [Mesorhizobium waimense]|uniref:Uncharacterized protein n=1 Tax=Mesorhizobium waimense TaxID=1300307 RepID=A0A3A5L7B6_9HYPH|nr:hypothetical protein [Mesorhizobium waimense]RJT42001.1 hypothetical protein D3227_04800 [Mesorhizobium waimense]